MNNSKLIIVGGLPRSGSTYLRFLLDSSDSILAGPETNFFNFPLWQAQGRAEKISDRLSKKLDIDYSSVSNAILNSTSSVDSFKKIMQVYAQTHNSNKVVFAEKTPRNCYAYSRISSESDNVYFISTMRSGLDIVTSKITDHHRNKGYWCSLQRYIDDCNAIFSFNHERHYIWNYEKAMLDPIGEARKVFDFVKEPFKEEYLDKVNQASTTRDLSKVNQPKLSQPLSSDWIERWRSPEHKEKVSEFLSNDQAMHWLKKTGYEYTK